MITQGMDKVLHLCFDLEKNRLRCCAENSCNDKPDNCRSPILPDGMLDEGHRSIKDCLEDIDWCLKVSSKEEWERFFEKRVDKLTQLLFHYKKVENYYNEASKGGAQLQIIIEQCLTGKTHQILSTPLEFWDIPIPVPRKHPVTRHLHFPSVVLEVEETLKLNGDPLVVLFVEAEEPDTATTTAKHYVDLLTSSLRTWWATLKYPEENLGIIRLDWSRATEDNIIKVLQGDPQPYFDVLDEEIESLHSHLKKTKEKNKREELKGKLEDKKRQKAFTKRILTQTPQGLIHWVGPMKYDEEMERLLVLPIHTSEQQPKELSPAKLAWWIRGAGGRIRWKFFFLASYAAGELPTRGTYKTSVDSSNLSQVVEELLGQANMSGVLAFLRPIRREAAETLFSTFYFEALKCRSVPQALLEARQNLYASHSGTCHYAWAVPILFELAERPIADHAGADNSIDPDAALREGLQRLEPT